MRKKVAGIAILLLIVLGFLFLCTGRKRTDIMLNDYAVSEDGKIMTINVGVASSMGYVRTIKAIRDGKKKYITFYETYGINSSIGAENEFQIELYPSCEKIYFYRGDTGFDLVLHKDSRTNEWKLAR